MLLASEDMITQRIDAHLARAKRAIVSVGKHLGDVRSETPAEKSLPHVRWELSYRLFITSVDHKGVTCYGIRGRGVKSRSLMTSVETRSVRKG